MTSLYIHLYDCFLLFPKAISPAVELMGQKVGTLFKVSQTYWQIGLQKDKLHPHQHCTLPKIGYIQIINILCQFHGQKPVILLFWFEFSHLLARLNIFPYGYCSLVFLQLVVYLYLLTVFLIRMFVFSLICKNPYF